MEPERIVCALVLPEKGLGERNAVSDECGA